MLRKALADLKNLFATPEHWIQDYDAAINPNIDASEAHFDTFEDFANDDQRKSFTCYCLRGGAFAVSPDSKTAAAVIHSLAKEIVELEKEGYFNIPEVRERIVAGDLKTCTSTVIGWNDDERRTVGQVQQLIDAALQKVAA